MRPLTPTDLQSILDTDLVWRRRELSTLVTTIRGSDIAAQIVLVRASIPLLYAHWEGFGRTCFQRYLEHVSLKNVKYKDLLPAFLYLSSLGRFQEVSRTPPRTAVSLLPDIFAMQEKVNRNPYRKMVDTKSNLRFEVLENLCAMCGLSAGEFTTDELFINHELCDPRNEIAHGAGSAPPVETFLKRRDRAFQIMVNLQTLIVNASVNKSYKQ